MESNSILCGDALTMLQTLPDQSVQCCITSPPYYRLRDYGVKGQIGLETTAQEYLETLIAVFTEVRRVLRGDGTCWVNMGDSYAYDEKWGGATSGKHARALHGKNATHDRRRTGVRPKNLLGIPWRLALALQNDGWNLRSEIIWHKPNAMPESVIDRPSKAHEHLFLLTKEYRYYYDADAIREPLKPKTYTTFGTHPTPTKGNDALGKVKSDNWNRTTQERQPKRTPDGQIAGANKRTVWTVASKPYKGAHFATFPPKLVEPCLLAGTSPQACEHCGAPWKRITEKKPMVVRSGPKAGGYGSRTTDGISGTMLAPAESNTLGWTPTCRCENNIGSGKCIVLDPFIGSGTIAELALQHGRSYIGIELNPAYLPLIEERLAKHQ